MATRIGRVLREQSAAIQADEPGVRAGVDPEAVHRMRVATRRLRTALRLLGAKETDGEPLRKLAEALGRVRDVDVLEAGLRARAQPSELPAVERLLAGRAATRATSQAALVATLDGGVLESVRKAADRARDEVHGVAAMTRALRGLRRAARLAASRASLHRARIRAKRLRYAGEFLADSYGSAIRECTRAAQEIHDLLGDVLDAENLVDELLRVISSLPDDAERCADSAALAAIAGRCRADADARLEQFAACWRAMPRAGRLRADLRAEAR
jgi:CHAD domain-containing protein